MQRRGSKKIGRPSEADKEIPTITVGLRISGPIDDSAQALQRDLTVHGRLLLGEPRPP